MMKNKIEDESANLIKNWRSFKNGKSKLRTWKIDPVSKKRTMKYKSIEDIRHERAAELKRIRAKELKMSQSQLANAIHVSTRTLQGWEIGKSLPPEPVMVLIKLMKDLPEVRSHLAHI
mgnify:CR=1 FL=1